MVIRIATQPKSDHLFPLPPWIPFMIFHCNSFMSLWVILLTHGRAEKETNRKTNQRNWNSELTHHQIGYKPTTMRLVLGSRLAKSGHSGWQCESNLPPPSPQPPPFSKHVFWKQACKTNLIPVQGPGVEPHSDYRAIPCSHTRWPYGGIMVPQPGEPKGCIVDLACVDGHSQCSWKIIL